MAFYIGQPHSHLGDLNNGMLHDIAVARGVFTVQCFDQNGILKWDDTFHNVVTAAGKNLALDSYLSSGGGSAPGGTGPYMGLIDASGFTAITALDTMTSHAGWNEYTLYSGSRKTCLFNAASSGSKSLSVALQFTGAATGTVKGAFIVLGTGASATITNTSGILYSVGSFNASLGLTLGDIIYIAYTASL